MSEFRRWLTGAEVMKRLDISRLDLLELVQNGRFQSYDPDTGAQVEIENRSLPFLPSGGFIQMPINLTRNGIKFLNQPENQLPKVSPEKLEKICFLGSQVEALEKEQQKTKPRNEDRRDKTPLGTVREIRPVLPYLEEAIKRKMFKPMMPWVEDSELSFLKTIFTPPTSHEEAVIRTLADMVVTLLDDPKNRIEPIISGALPEIDEAYNAVLQEGGGWSARKGGPERRQAAVLAWFDRNEARLSHLKKPHLEDPNLYNDGGGQEKRNFRIRLIGKVVEETAHQRITSQEIIDTLRRLKKSEKDLSGESLLRNIYAIAKL